MGLEQAKVDGSSSNGMHLPSVPAAAASTAVVPAGRRLKILEHRVHKVEMRTKETGEQEEELVVSNLRPFTLKVGVRDHLDTQLHDCSLPLRATLLYENGLAVKQTSTSEPLLVGETDVVALQGTATFKLRITSLSSHRDKQRFRIQIAPQDVEVQLHETGLVRGNAPSSQADPPRLSSRLAPDACSCAARPCSRHRVCGCRSLSCSVWSQTR